MTATLLVFLSPGGEAIRNVYLADAGADHTANIDVAAVNKTSADRVIAVFAGEDVSTWSVELPALADAKLMQILRSQIEDLKATSGADDHDALLKSTADNKRIVACVSRAVMDSALSVLARANVNADLFVPDYALVPSANKAVVLKSSWDTDRFIVRMPDETGFAADEVVARAITDVSAAETYTPDAGVPDDISAFNLLQGRYRPRLAFAVYIPLFRRSLALALVALCVWLASMITGAYRLQQQADNIYAETEALFASAFPEITRIVDMQTQARRLVAQSAREEGGNFLRLSERIFGVVARYSGAVIEGLRYNQDQNAFFVTVSVSSFAESDAFLAELRNSDLTVTEGGSRQEEGRVITDIAVEVAL